MRSYKIAVVAACPFPFSRGTPIRIFRMAEALAARGHDVHVITYHLGEKMDDLPFKVHRTPHVPTYTRTAPGPSYQKLALLDPLLCIKILSILNRYKFDIIHAHHYEGLLAALPAARVFGVPLVFDSHTLLAAELPHYPMGLPKGMLLKIAEKLDRWAPARANHVVTVNNSIRDDLIREAGIAETKVTTIYSGIEVEHFSVPQAPASSDARKTLIYAGNLASYQGIDLMLKAFSKVLQYRRDVSLKIITDHSIGPYQNMIAMLGLGSNLIVEQCGYFDLPGQLLTGMIALHPRVESNGMPIKLLNYMASGRAIVSFEGSAEVLEHERTGLVIPNNDIDAFANAIIRLLDSQALAERLGAAAKLKTHQFFVWEKSVEMLEDIYRSLLEKKT